jgi:hypothetical protein
MMAIGNQTLTFLDYIAFFLAGALLANGVPHFVKGICGEKFVTPLALLQGEKQSSALVNVIWGWINFAIGAWLLHHFSPVRMPPATEPCITAACGALVCAIYLAWRFGKATNVEKARKKGRKA